MWHFKYNECSVALPLPSSDKKFVFEFFPGSSVKGSSVPDGLEEYDSGLELQRVVCRMSND